MHRTSKSLRSWGLEYKLRQNQILGERCFHRMMQILSVIRTRMLRLSKEHHLPGIAELKKKRNAPKRPSVKSLFETPGLIRRQRGGFSISCQLNWRNLKPRCLNINLLELEPLNILRNLCKDKRNDDFSR